MLVLSRKKEQEVCLPELGVNIKVLQVKGNTVRLGIEAPEDVHILRGELNEFRREFSDEITVSLDEDLSLLEQVA
jgi:carbon storage regulator